MIVRPISNTTNNISKYLRRCFSGALITSEITSALDHTRDCVDRIKARMDCDVIRKRIFELNTILVDEHIWEDIKRATSISKELGTLKRKVEVIESAENQLEEFGELLQMGVDENDAEIVDECKKLIQQLNSDVHNMELESMLSGKGDNCSAYVEINPGAGGTESCDWAEMLKTMYEKWGRRNDHKVSTVDNESGSVAGIERCILSIEGYQVYGWLKHESGVHRLVRHSPFDSSNKRHTSFARVRVSPLLDEAEVEFARDIELKTSDLKIDTYRASGAGGQHVNTTESAVRITHLPTGEIVQCQNERSQHSNKASCLQLLKSRLFRRKLELRAKEKSEANKSMEANAFGSQIRSYVLAPYQMVKDHRNKYETSRAEQVLNGDLHGFLEASLLQVKK